MAIKKLTEKKVMNARIGIIGTLKGKVIDLNVGNGEYGMYAYGKILVEGAEYPTFFNVSNTRKNPSLVDEFVSSCEKSAVVSVIAVPSQKDYEDPKNRSSKRSTSL